MVQSRMESMEIGVVCIVSTVDCQVRPSESDLPS